MHVHDAAIRGLTPPAPPPEVDLDHVAPIRVSVRDAADALLVQLRGTERTTFRALVAGIDDRIEVIVRFLAVLELYKQGIVDVDQVETFGDLTVWRLSAAESLIDLDAMDDWEDGARPVTPEEAEADAAEDAELDAMVVTPAEFR
jgi:segregation and condensation protein A